MKKICLQALPAQEWDEAYHIRKAGVKSGSAIKLQKLRLKTVNLGVKQ